MAEWISGWKKIAKYLDVSIKTAQRMAKKKVIPVYPGIRAEAKELDKHLKQ